MACAELGRDNFGHTCGNLEGALGECLLAQKRYDEAESLLLTGHADLEKRLGSQSVLMVQARRHLHDLYLAWNKPSETAHYEAGPAPQAPPSLEAVPSRVNATRAGASRLGASSKPWD